MQIDIATGMEFDICVCSGLDMVHWNCMKLFISLCHLTGISTIHSHAMAAMNDSSWRPVINLSWLHEQFSS